MPNNIAFKEKKVAEKINNNKVIATKIILPKKSALKLSEKSITIKNGDSLLNRDYSIALINEELLNKDKDLQLIATTIAEREQAIAKTFLIKIEEEQSGKSQKNTYYFELDNKGGKRQLKPLLILNKYIDILNKANPQKVSNPGRTKKGLKQRTTS
jgi:hypothetical protein